MAYLILLLFPIVVYLLVKHAKKNNDWVRK